jgi:hypothetical protein
MRPNRRKKTTFMTVLCAVCLLTCAWQTVWPQESTAVKPKSVGTATRYSVLGTIVPAVVGGVVIMAGRSESEDPEGEGTDYDNDPTCVGIGFSLAALGAAIGPGLGHAYAGRRGHFVKGSLIRAAGALLITNGIIGSDISGFSKGEDKGSDAATIMIGGAIYLWSAIHDYRTLNDAVERYNQKYAGVTVSVNPAYFAGENAPGIIVNLSF